MTRAKIVNLCFQLLAAFWAAIVLLKAQTSVRWHTYVVAVVGVIVISAVGTRLKHRIQNRAKASTPEEALKAAPKA